MGIEFKTKFTQFSCLLQLLLQYRHLQKIMSSFLEHENGVKYNFQVQGNGVQLGYHRHGNGMQFGFPGYKM